MSDSGDCQLRPLSGETSPAHLVKQWAGTQGNISPKKTCRRQQAHKELLNITGHRGNANQNRGETPTHTHPDGSETPNARNWERTSVGAMWGHWNLSCGWWGVNPWTVLWLLLKQLSRQGQRFHPKYVPQGKETRTHTDTCAQVQGRNHPNVRVLMTG